MFDFRGYFKQNCKNAPRLPLCTQVGVYPKYKILPSFVVWVHQMFFR